MFLVFFARPSPSYQYWRSSLCEAVWGEGGKLGNEATYVSAISTTNERFSIDETVQWYLGWGGCDKNDKKLSMT